MKICRYAVVVIIIVVVVAVVVVIPRLPARSGPWSTSLSRATGISKTRESS
jgi:hypothetical protein